MTAYISRDDSAALAHYGVMGMKWGVRKNEERKKSNARSSKSIVKSIHKVQKSVGKKSEFLNTARFANKTQRIAGEYEARARQYAKYSDKHLKKGLSSEEGSKAAKKHYNLAIESAKLSDAYHKDAVHYRNLGKKAINQYSKWGAKISSKQVYRFSRRGNRLVMGLGIAVHPGVGGGAAGYLASKGNTSYGGYITKYKVKDPRK